MRLMTLAALMIPTTFQVACASADAKARTPEPALAEEQQEIRLVLDEDGKRYEFSGEDQQQLLEMLRQQLKGQEDAAEIEAKVRQALAGIHVDVEAIHIEAERAAERARVLHLDDKVIAIQVERAMHEAEKHALDEERIEREVEKALRRAEERVKEIEVRLAKRGDELTRHVEHLRLSAPEVVLLHHGDGKVDVDTLLKLIEKAELSEADRQRLRDALK
ncbi:hypothetical protein [Gallaecimonas sp. GXIMD4217]|uniref:hypothetical protein n=1 Tax=Gallaecimonas sp. GXIMD4217 TaxID=3131927 RepID=UPI00311B0122